MKPKYDDLLEAIRAVGPLTIVSGDCYQRTNPGHGLRLNMTATWAVGDGHRSRKGLEQAVLILNSACNNEKE